MFILPANNRPTALTSALQGISQSYRLIKQGAQERLQQQQQSRVAQLLKNDPEAFRDPRNIIEAVRSGAMSEKVGVSLLENLSKEQAANAPYVPANSPVGTAPQYAQHNTPGYDTTHSYEARPNADSYNQTGNGPTSPRDSMAARQGTEVSTKMPIQGNPLDQSESQPSPEGLPNSGAIFEPKLEFKPAPTVEDLRRSRVSKVQHEINETARKEHNERVKQQKDLERHYETENAPVRQQAAKAIEDGQKTLAAGLRLQKINEKGNIKGKLNAPLNAIAEHFNMDATTFLNADEQEFQKEISNLLPTYLRNSYAGRILLAEVNEQRKGLVQNVNSADARKRLIQSIVDLGRNAIEAGHDYDRLVKKYGRGDPLLVEHMIQASEERFLKQNGNKTIHVQGFDGEEHSVKYKDLKEFERDQLELQQLLSQ